MGNDNVISIEDKKPEERIDYWMFYYRLGHPDLGYTFPRSFVSLQNKLTPLLTPDLPDRRYLATKPIKYLCISIYTILYSSPSLFRQSLRTASHRSASPLGNPNPSASSHRSISPYPTFVLPHLCARTSNFCAGTCEGERRNAAGIRAA